MNVVRKGEEYTISFDFTYGDDNENIKGYYQGTLNNFGPVKMLLPPIWLPLIMTILKMANLSEIQ